MTSRRHVAADAIERRDALLDGHARGRARLPRLRHLPARHAPDVARGGRDRRADPGGEARPRVAHLLLCDLDGDGKVVELLRVAEQRTVAVAPHGRHDPRHAALDFRVAPRRTIQQRADRPFVPAVEDPHGHITILLSGYSTIPCALAFFSRGIRSRTVRSSMIVFTATQSSSLSGETVGLCRAGRSARTLSSAARRTFSMMPTRPCASIAALSSNAMFPSLVAFHESAIARSLAMSRVFDSTTVSMMRRRLARSDDPVSVTSTMASARTGGFTSVAPQENSTLTFTFLRAKYASVARTSSVAIVAPSRSSADWKRESSGTASTHRTLPKLCFA